MSTETSGVSGAMIATVFKSLAEERVWVAWNNDGKKKVPAGRATTNKPASWKTLADVENVKATGVGIILTDRQLTGGLACVDLDGCRDPKTGELAEWANDRIKRLNSYAEVSPSGTGVKVFVTTAEPLEDAREAVAGRGSGGKKPAVELFAGSGSRFVAVTGEHIMGTPLGFAVVQRDVWVGLLPAKSGVPETKQDPPTMVELEEALAAVPAHDRDIWARVTAALKHAADDDVLPADELHELWDKWSATAPESYDRRGNEAAWRSFRRTGGRVATLGTVFFLARQHGWKGKTSKLGFPDVNKDDTPKPTVPSTVHALKLLGIEVRYDLFKLRESVSGHTLAEFAGDVQDPAIHRLREIIHAEFGFYPPREAMVDAIHTLGNHHRHHPVRDYLDSLEWDGVERIDCWLTEYAGAEDTPFVRAVGALFLVAAVRRVRKPGCKFDEVLVLEGAQGTGKSQALEALAVDREWFTDQSPLGHQDREVIEILGGRWIVEIAELKGMKNSEIEAVKSFTSRQVDRARLAYGMVPTDAPRQCVFFATTNDEHYLKDPTGNRRFWPVRIVRFDLERLRADRDQLWAEAAHREAQNRQPNDEDIRLPEELWAAAAVQQAERQVENPFLAELDRLLREPDELVSNGRWEPGAPLEGKVLVTDLMAALDLPPTRTGQHHIEQVASAMRELGWRKPDNGDGKLRVNGRKAHVWVKGEGPDFRAISIEPPGRNDDGQRTPPTARYSDKLVARPDLGKTFPVLPQHQP